MNINKNNSISKLGVMFTTIFTFCLVLFLLYYPPQKVKAQNNKIYQQVDTPINTVLDSLIKQGNILTDDVKSEAERGRQLAKIAERNSRNIKPKIKYITITHVRPGDTFYKYPDINDPIILQSDSTYQPIKQSLWKRIFGKSNKNK